MNGPRSYLRRADTLWWARRTYLAYTLREATGIAVAGYAFILLAGLISLAESGAIGGRVLFWHTGGLPALFAMD